MAKLLLDYTVLDEEYENGKFWFFQGEDGRPTDVELPKDTGLAGPIGPMDSDPVVHSYMGGADQGEARALVSVISNDQPQETAKYSVCVPATPGAPVVWTAGGPQGVRFVSSGKPPVPIVGNPYGVAQVGKHLYFVDYDTTDIYMIDIAIFEASGKPNYDLAANTYTIFPDDITNAKIFPIPAAGGYSARGAALITLTDARAEPVAWLYAAYNILSVATPGQPTVYDNSVVVRFKVDPATGALTEGTYITVGKNVQGLIPVYGGPDGIALLIPCIGGPQNFGSTNGAESALRRVPAFDSFTDDNSIAAFTGDRSSAALALAGSWDIKSAAASEDGLVYLLTETEDEDFNTWWKLYKTTVAAVLDSAGVEILEAVNSDVLTQIDSGVGSKGFEWHLMYENAVPASNGRLWFVKGTPIQVSQGEDYNTKLLFDTGALYPSNSSDPLDSISYKNVNSADLIGEMIYQHNKGHSVDTRLIKGKSASGRAGQSGAVEEEEEK
jgi:hypothetical protein